MYTAVLTIYHPSYREIQEYDYYDPSDAFTMARILRSRQEGVTWEEPDFTYVYRGYDSSNNQVTVFVRNKDNRNLVELPSFKE